MPEISMETIKELRSRTGCGIVDCKEALAEAGGDVEEAIANLRKKGVVKAAKKADRDTSEGIIATYIHGPKLGVIVSLQCETDFVARNEAFQALGQDIAMHIAATDPVVVSPSDMPKEAIAAEKEVAMTQMQAEAADKPDEIREKIVEGKLKKFAEERALLTQPFIKDPTQTVQDRINAAVQEMGENITVGEFHRVTL